MVLAFESLQSAGAEANFMVRQFKLSPQAGALQREEAEDVRLDRQLLRLARGRPRSDRLHRRHLHGHRRQRRRHLLLLHPQLALQVRLGPINQTN